MALLNDPGWLRFIGDKSVHSEADARRYLENGPLAMYARDGFGLCAVERTSDGATIGMCGLIRRKGLDDVDIGYAFLPAARGSGFAVEAARAVLADGLDARGIRRVVAIMSRDNDASAKVLTAIGMRFEREVQMPEGGEPLALWAIERV